MSFYMLDKITKKINNEILFFCVYLVILSASFFHGWIVDESKPRSGIGWADQSYYLAVAEKIAHGVQLAPEDFHYQLGYSLLGAICIKFGFRDPFMVVSYTCLLLSALLLFFAARNHFTIFYSYLFVFLVFFVLVMFENFIMHKMYFYFRGIIKFYFFAFRCIFVFFVLLVFVKMFFMFYLLFLLLPDLQSAQERKLFYWYFPYL